jgi:hypothetical protein
MTKKKLASAFALTLALTLAVVAANPARAFNDLPFNDRFAAALPSETVPLPSAPRPSVVRDSVPIYQSDSAKVMVDALLGGQRIRLTLDTGSDVTVITMDVARSILRAGHGQLIGDGRFTMADGHVTTQPMMLVDFMVVGEHILKNVRVTISDMMLLGFHEVNGIGPFTINTRTHKLTWEAER